MVFFLLTGAGLSSSGLLAQGAWPGPNGTAQEDAVRTLRIAQQGSQQGGVCVATAAAQLNRILPQYEGMVRRPGDASSVDKSTTTYSADVITFTASPTGGCSSHLVEDVDEYDADLVSISFSPQCDSDVTQETGTEDDYITLDPSASSGCTAHIVEDVDEYDADLTQVTFYGGGCDGTLTESSSGIYMVDGDTSFDTEVLAIRFAASCDASVGPIEGMGDSLALAFEGGCAARLSDDIDSAQIDVITLTVRSAGFLRLGVEGVDLDVVLFDADSWLDGGAFDSESVLSNGRLSQDESLFVPVMPGAYALHVTNSNGAAGTYDLKADLFDAPVPEESLCGGTR